MERDAMEHEQKEAQRLQDEKLAHEEALRRIQSFPERMAQIMQARAPSVEQPERERRDIHG